MVSLFKRENIPLGPLFCWCAFFSAEIYSTFFNKLYFFPMKLFFVGGVVFSTALFCFPMLFYLCAQFYSRKKEVVLVQYLNRKWENQSKKILSVYTVQCTVFTSRMLYLAGFQDILSNSSYSDKTSYVAVDGDHFPYSLAKTFLAFRMVGKKHEIETKPLKPYYIQFGKVKEYIVCESSKNVLFGAA